jgi:RNA polymerase sigma-70 factor (ECF subfamily)
LLERAKQGDEMSRERLYRLYGRLVWKIYLAKVPPQDRMDLCQEVFQTVFQKLAGFRKNTMQGPGFRAWLRRISHHKVGAYLRRRHRDGFLLSNSALEAVAAGAEPVPSTTHQELDEQAELVRSAFEEVAAGFENRTLEAVRRMVLQDQPAEAVASALGMSRSAVYTAKTRVLARVRAIMEELDEPV